MDEEESEHTIHTQCPTCMGDRYIARPTMAALHGELTTITQLRKCPSCEGRGWLPGFVIPV